MLEFPDVPKWWKNATKFTKLKRAFETPKWIVGYDTETCFGEIMTQQVSSGRYQSKEVKSSIEWVKGETVLDKFLNQMFALDGHVICFCFNAKFDLSILLRQYINEFLRDDFQLRHTTSKGRNWDITVMCSKNWSATFKCGNTFINFLDIQNFFSGSLAKVANTFQLEIKKLERPDALGSKYFYQNDKQFVAYALMDALLCLEIGTKIIDMHQEFDIPLSSSSANFAEKVFRREFIPGGIKIQFPQEFSCLRLAELSYHGGKNGYYLDNPSYISNCFEYDFNSAYPYSMFSLPSFVSGKYEKVTKFNSEHVGIYHTVGTIKPCKFGVLYNAKFDYYRFSENIKVESFCTSYELQEAIDSKEFKMESAKGWIWKPSSKESPLADYCKHFWNLKNSTPKKDIKYIFYKLLLNSLYGKWIQRNPKSQPEYQCTNGKLKLIKKQEVAGGLYHPFIASLITGNTRARLHQAEHHYDAIESSTDSVKSRRYDIKSDHIKAMGTMQLEHHYCVPCGKEITKVNGLFVRNRLNLLMCKKEHVVKCALHGFWGRPEKLLDMYHKKEYIYQIDRMPLIREGIKQVGKNLFEMHTEERSINVSWDSLTKE